jgi:hypothetical protein
MFAAIRLCWHAMSVWDYFSLYVLHFYTVWSDTVSLLKPSTIMHDASGS